MEESAFYKWLVAGMRCGILTIDRDGRLVMVNEPARQILEISEEPAPGTSIEVALREHQQLAQILRESFNLSSLPSRAEIDLQSRSDRGKTIGFTISLIRDEGSRPIGAAIFFKDLTHVEHKEERERLRDRLAALGQMSANLAHEIRNPLASIEVSCSLLKRRLRNEAAVGDLLDKIIAEVRRLDRTITSSLEFVRPISPALAPARIEPILDEALAVANGRGSRPGILIRKEYASNVPEFLLDRGQIREVFVNLFLNAMEAMGPEGRLDVATTVVPAPAAASIPYRPPGSADSCAQAFDHYVEVRVADTGCGIAEEHVDKLFYPFFTTKKQGSGVGLSMAKKIVDSHRGLIDVETQRGAGTVFRVRLPMVRTELAGVVA